MTTANTLVTALLAVLFMGGHVQAFTIVGMVSMSQHSNMFKTALFAKPSVGKMGDSMKDILPDFSALGGGEGQVPPEALGAAGLLGAFAVATFSMRQGKDEREATQSGGKSRGKVKPIDVSIPYDAAARLAFEEFQSGGQHEGASFEDFNVLYKEKTVAEVIAKKKARDIDRLGK